MKKNRRRVNKDRSNRTNHHPYGDYSEQWIYDHVRGQSNDLVRFADGSIAYGHGAARA
jgi:hypothetical protein